MQDRPTADSNKPGQTGSKRRLGRGLNALLGGSGPAGAAPARDQEPGGTIRVAPGTERSDGGAADESQPPASDLIQVDTSAIEASPFQPRRDFDAEELADLTGSVREHGILQPVLVRELGNADSGPRYQLVAGERRLKAARKAGLNVIPARVVDVVDQTACEYALEENLKRADLNDLEKARAFRAYMEQFQVTVADLARQLSMSAPAVSNTLRLLDLPEVAQRALSEGRISAGHARCILAVPAEADRLELCGRIQAEGLTVRQAEAESRVYKERSASDDSDEAPATIPLSSAKQGPDKASSTAKDANRWSTPHVRDIESRIRDAAGVKAEIRQTAKEKGRIVLPFSSGEEFERLTALLLSNADSARKAA